MGNEANSDYDPVQEYNQRLLDNATYEQDPEKDFRLARWQLDTTEIFDRLEHIWRGDVFTKNGEWENVNEFRVMNEIGIRSLRNLLEAAMNRNVFLSNYSEDAIKTNMLYTMVTFTTFLASRYEDFEIHKRNLTIIKEQIRQCLEASLYRSLNAGERKAIYQSQRVIETLTNKPQQEKQGGGFFGLFKGGK